MKSAKLLLVSVAVSICLAPVFAQNYAINWHTVGGGGGTSSGGIYSLSGTIGQPDAGVLTGAGFELVGGFWSVLSCVPSGVFPALTVYVTTNDAVVVAWPCSTSSSIVLQECTNIYAPNWVPPSQPIVYDGITKSVTIAPAVGSLFFRLAELKP
jgi:hypothetical protein